MYRISIPKFKIRRIEGDSAESRRIEIDRRELSGIEQNTEESSSKEYHILFAVLFFPACVLVILSAARLLWFLKDERRWRVVKQGATRDVRL